MFPNPFARPIFLLRHSPAITPHSPAERRNSSLSPPPLPPGVSPDQYRRNYHRSSTRRRSPSPSHRRDHHHQQRIRWTNHTVFKKRRLKVNVERKWVEAEEAETSVEEDDKFILMTYNILGDDNCTKHTDLYRNVPLEDMKWKSRKTRICIEIRARNPDLLCLQEVDKVQDIMKYMRSEGYEGIHKGRNGDAKDGCALFWKKEKFNLNEDDSIDFSEFNLRHNVAQLLVLEAKNSSKKIVIGNIHVLFTPRRGDIKLAQIRMLLERADFLSTKYGGIPILLAGDFNCTPSSAMYKFLTSKEIDLSVYNRCKMSGLNPDFVPWTGENKWPEEELRTAIGDIDTTILKNPLKLQSSYASIKGDSLTRGLNEEPLATSYHSKFLGTVDYLWYSSGLACLRVLDTLSLNLLREMGELPTEEIGSDHLSLVAEFSFINKRKPNN